jgi:hypothetical protein
VDLGGSRSCSDMHFALTFGCNCGRFVYISVYFLYLNMKKFRNDYKPTTKSVKGKTSELFADFHNILNRWKNCFASC